MCVDSSSSEALETLMTNTPFLLESILMEPEGWRYVVPILPGSLLDILAGRRQTVSSGSGSGGSSGGGGGSSTASKNQEVGASGEGIRVWMRYSAHLPVLSVRDRENLWTLLARTIVTTLRDHVICKNWHLWVGGCWEDCECKNSHIPTPTKLDQTIARLLKTAWVH